MQHLCYIYVSIAILTKNLRYGVLVLYLYWSCATFKVSNCMDLVYSVWVSWFAHQKRMHVNKSYISEGSDSWHSAKTERSSLPRGPLILQDAWESFPKRGGPARLSLDADLDCLHGAQSNVCEELGWGTGCQVQRCTPEVRILLQHTISVLQWFSSILHQANLTLQQRIFHQILREVFISMLEWVQNV